jgi:hypothetical protein
MVRVECVATKGYVAFICIPLLTELGSTEDGFGYKHAAPKGAVSTRQQCIPRTPPKNLALRASAHGRRSWVQMISNDQELQAALKRVRQIQLQEANLRRVERNPENYRLSVSGYLAELDRMTLEVRDYLMGGDVNQRESRAQPPTGSHQLVRGVFVAQQPGLHVVWATRQRSVSFGNARA